LSLGGSLYPQILLGLRLTDVTAGFRAYRATTLEDMDLSAIQSKGYGCQVDMTFRTARLGKRIVEVPITFSEREVRASELCGDSVPEACAIVTKRGVAARAQSLGRRFGR